MAEENKNIGVSHDDFSADSFFIAVTTSEVLASMSQKERDELKWFLFNAEEQIQRDFFAILREERSILNQRDNEMAMIKAKLYEEFLAHVKQEGVQFEKDLRKQEESLVAQKDHASSEALLNEL